MQDFFNNYWQYLLAVLLMIGGFKVPFLQKLILLGLRAFMTEKVLSYVVLKFIEKLVQSTKTKLDDIWFAEFKKQFDEGKIDESD